MQSYTDLNTFANTSVNYNSANDFVITFGANAGNYNINLYEGELWQPQKQVPLNSVSGITRDILVEVIASTVDALAFVEYRGSNANIEVFFDGLTNWTVTGIRTVADYNDVWTNLYAGLDPAFLNTFAITVLINPQVGTVTPFYTINVTVLENPVFTAPTSIGYVEDSILPVGNISITETFAFATNYTITITPADNTVAKIGFSPGNVALNSYTLTGSKATINTTMANFVFIPAADFSGNTSFTTQVTRIYSNLIVGRTTTANCIAFNTEYSAPPGYIFNPSFVTQIGTTASGNLRITDAAVSKNYTSNISLANPATGTFSIGNTVIGNSVSLSGSKTTVNANLANLTFTGANSANASTNLIYVQNQTTDSILQANITIPMVYQPTSIHINTGVDKLPGTRLNHTGGGNVQQSPATANVDFWGYQYSTSNTTISGQVFQIYTNPTNANIALTSIRDTVDYYYQPKSVKISGNFGLQSRLVAGQNPGTAGYFSFWLRLNKAQRYSTILGVEVDGTVTIPNYSNLNLTLVTWDNRLYWHHGTSTNIYVWNTAPSPSFFDHHVDLGPVPTVSQWNHFAVQISTGTTGSSGTQVVSFWKNGQPITAIYGYVNNVLTLQNGTNWAGKGGFDTMKGFVAGSPLRPPQSQSGATSTEGRNESLEQVWPDVNLDDIYMTNQAIRADQASFTPEPLSYVAPPATMLVTGV